MFPGSYLSQVKIIVTIDKVYFLSLKIGNLSCCYSSQFFRSHGDWASFTCFGWYESVILLQNDQFKSVRSIWVYYIGVPTHLLSLAWVLMKISCVLSSYVIFATHSNKINYIVILVSEGQTLMLCVFSIHRVSIHVKRCIGIWNVLELLGYICYVTWETLKTAL